MSYSLYFHNNISTYFLGVVKMVILPYQFSALLLARVFCREHSPYQPFSDRQVKSTLENVILFPFTNWFAK